MSATKKNYCLSIETSGVSLGLALVAYDLTEAPFSVSSVSSFFKPLPLQHSDRLLPELDRLLKAEKMTLSRVNLIAVDIGPGSFTGVRLGVSAARALGQAFSIPLVGVSSLEALALAMGRGLKAGGRFAVGRPALAGEVYGAVYEFHLAGRAGGVAGLQTIDPPSWLSEKEFARVLKKNRLKTATVREESPSPVHIAEIGLWRFLTAPNSRLFSYERLVPSYLQPSWAERQRLTKPG